ncbi:MAG: SoxXA-binding protein [Acidiferrobacteraceae bacterium]
MKTTWGIVIALLALGGCATTNTEPTAASGSSRAADQAVAKAQAAVDKTAAMAALWSTTAQDLKKAEQAKTAGKNAQAIRLANEVLQQTELAQAQAHSQANAKPSYPAKL